MKINILNTKIDNYILCELLSKIKEDIVPPSLNYLLNLEKDKGFYDVYQSSDYRICDSKLVQLASKFLATPMIEIKLPQTGIFSLLSFTLVFNMILHLRKIK